jgi:hypothetical protein
LPWGPRVAIIHLREREYRDAVVVQSVIVEFCAHVNHVRNASGDNLIYVSFAMKASTYSNPLRYEIERYAWTRRRM